jgi:tRNA (cmo5U34)-methyltransferase
MNDFDKKAAEWDTNPVHWDRSAAIVDEIRRRIRITRSMTAMEYGAGTGIASFLLKDHLREITMIDSSPEMVKMARAKIKHAGAENLSAVKMDLLSDEYSGEKFDLIFTQMVLHHVDDVDAILARFSELLNPGGFVAIADLYEEDGSFHGEGFTGHKGFNPIYLENFLIRLGFIDAISKQCFTLSRKISGEETRYYDIFLVTARKN